MSLATVLASIQWYTEGAWSLTAGRHLDAVPAADKSKIIEAIESLYTSPAARSMLEDAAAAGTLRVGQSLGAGFWTPSIAPAPSYFGLNTDEIDNLYWFNDSGVLVKADLKLVIAHELEHYRRVTLGLPGQGPENDEALMNGSNFDFNGPQVDKQNVVADELNIENYRRVSYHATLNNSLSDLRFGEFTIGHSYSYGFTVDIVRIGDDPVPLEDNLDMSARTDNSSDLLFGLSGDDVLKGGGGRDFLMAASRTISSGAVPGTIFFMARRTTIC